MMKIIIQAIMKVVKLHQLLIIIFISVIFK